MPAVHHDINASDNIFAYVVVGAIHSLSFVILFLTGSWQFFLIAALAFYVFTFYISNKAIAALYYWIRSMK